MTEEEVNKLPNGVYVITWAGGNKGVCSLGRNREGKVWIAPSNWLTVGQVDDWRNLKSLELLATGEEFDSPSVEAHTPSPPGVKVVRVSVPGDVLDWVYKFMGVKL